jgi:hypothetical protein
MSSSHQTVASEFVRFVIECGRGPGLDRLADSLRYLPDTETDLTVRFDGSFISDASKVEYYIVGDVFQLKHVNKDEVHLEVGMSGDWSGEYRGKAIGIYNYRTRTGLLHVRWFEKPMSRYKAL